MDNDVRENKKRALLHWLNCRRDHLKHPDSAYCTERFNKAVAALDEAKCALADQEEIDREESARDRAADLNRRMRDDERCDV